MKSANVIVCRPKVKKNFSKFNGPTSGYIVSCWELAHYYDMGFWKSFRRMVIFFHHDSLKVVLYFNKIKFQIKKFDSKRRIIRLVLYLMILSYQFYTLNLTINDLLGGRGWWLVKGVSLRDPFLFALLRSLQLIFLYSSKHKTGEINFFKSPYRTNFFLFNLI